MSDILRKEDESNTRESSGTDANVRGSSGSEQNSTNENEKNDDEETSSNSSSTTLLCTALKSVLNKWMLK
jgi:hypothetical protein